MVIKIINVGKAQSIQKFEGQFDETLTYSPRNCLKVNVEGSWNEITWYFRKTLQKEE